MTNYKLLTPGPLTTSMRVKLAMLHDHCTWDNDYLHLTETIRHKLLELAQVSATDYTSILIQGSGSYGIEALLGSVLNKNHKVLLLSNGVYGERGRQMLTILGIPYLYYDMPPNQTFDPEKVRQLILQQPALSHIYIVHCETTSGIINSLADIGTLAREYGKVFMVDAMSSFGGMIIPMSEWHIDFLVSSPNKCLQGVPGFCFIIARRESMKALSQQHTPSLVLNLYQQWKEMEECSGKWRYTSPTHCILAFAEALTELEEEGGIAMRHQRYKKNQQILSESLSALGFTPYLPSSLQSVFITSFFYPSHTLFSFTSMYDYVKRHGYALYPGKLMDTKTFRVGSIGAVYPEDFRLLAMIIQNYLKELSA